MKWTQVEFHFSALFVSLVGSEIELCLFESLDAFSVELEAIKVPLPGPEFSDLVLLLLVGEVHLGELKRSKVSDIFELRRNPVSPPQNEGSSQLEGTTSKNEEVTEPKLVHFRVMQALSESASKVDSEQVAGQVFWELVLDEPEAEGLLIQLLPEPGKRTVMKFKSVHKKNFYQGMATRLVSLLLE